MKVIVKLIMVITVFAFAVYAVTMLASCGTVKSAERNHGESGKSDCGYCVTTKYGITVCIHYAPASALIGGEEMPDGGLPPGIDEREIMRDIGKDMQQ